MRLKSDKTKVIVISNQTRAKPYEVGRHKCEQINPTCGSKGLRQRRANTYFLFPVHVPGEIRIFPTKTGRALGQLPPGTNKPRTFRNGKGVPRTYVRVARTTADAPRITAHVAARTNEPVEKPPARALPSAMDETCLLLRCASIRAPAYVARFD